MIFVNFKTYQESTGGKALSLIKMASSLSDETGLKIISCPQTVDLESALSQSKDVWAQHLDNKERGKATGWFAVEVAKQMGITGTFLNHSEHKLIFSDLEETIDLCQKNSLSTLIFAGSLEEAKKVAKLKPDFIGYEPPELVGSKETSVAKEKPEIIEKVVREIPEIPIIVGAGIKNAEDVRVSLSLGAKGIAVSSAVVLADNPEEVLGNLAKGFKK